MKIQPYDIFEANVDNELKSRIKDLKLSERIKLIAINHHFKMKKNLDLKLDNKIQQFHQQNELQTLELNKKIYEILEEDKKVWLTEDLANIIDLEKQNEAVKIGINTSLENSRRMSDLSKSQQKFSQSQILEKSQTLITSSLENYWYFVFRNCTLLEELLDQNIDQKLIRHLKRISYQREEPKNIKNQNFTIQFSFSKLPVYKETGTKENKNQANFFEKEDHIEAYKTFVMHDSCNVLRTEVTNPFSKETQKKIKGQSFFSFFTEATDVRNFHPIPKSHPNYKELMQQRQEEERRIGRDFEIAQTICKEIIPFSLEYYLGVRGDYRIEADNKLNKFTQLLPDMVDDKINNRFRQQSENLETNQNSQNLQKRCQQF